MGTPLAKSALKGGLAMKLLTADRLRAIMANQNPFLPSGELRPADQRYTFLAANANFPFEVFAQALVAAAGDSPLFLQASRNALHIAGQGIAGNDRQAVFIGARRLRFLVEEFVAHYQAPAVALALDHYRLPEFDPTARPEPGQNAAVLHEAIQACSVVGLDSDYSHDAYLAYLSGPAYQEAKRELQAVVQILAPAWVMVDTEDLPPVLAFAVARDMGMALRPGGQGPMLEAEFGGIGGLAKGGADQADLSALAAAVTAFVRFSAADAVAYDIGMEHGAAPRSGHQPDEERLLTVQRHLGQELGRYVPFVQHGGTGAAYLARGLVGKNNINTHFLVTAARALLESIDRRREGIQRGHKYDCSVAIYRGLMEAVAAAAREKLAETGTLGKAQQILAAVE
jgi:fructose/tagatose bisphosphate aldolase